MKRFSIISNRTQDETRNTYKTLEELSFADLYIEVPEQDFSNIKAATEQSIKWLKTKKQLYSSPSHSYTLFALTHVSKFIYKTIKYSH